MKNIKPLLDKLIKKLVEPKLKKLGFESISVEKIKLPDKTIGGVFVNTKPIIRKIKDLSDSQERNVENKIETFIYDMLEMIGEEPMDYLIHINKNLSNIKLDENKLPFDEKINGNKRFRKFHETVDEGELQWHRDREDRIVIPTHQTDWKVQLDNELPISLVEGEEIQIPKGVYHRLIKGTGDLNLTVILK